MKHSEILFVYGTLKNPKIQKEVIGRIVGGIHEVVEGYKLSKIKLEDKFYPIAVPRKDEYLEGLVLYITTEELKLIDEYEGKEYKRSKVRTILFPRYTWLYHR